MLTNYSMLQSPCTRTTLTHSITIKTHSVVKAAACPSTHITTEAEPPLAQVNHTYLTTFNLSKYCEAEIPAVRSAHHTLRQIQDEMLVSTIQKKHR